MTEQEAWKLATNKVASGIDDHCPVWVKDGNYSTAFSRGAVRVGYISKSRDGRFWQTVDANDSRHELDPAKGLMSFIHY